MNDWYFPGEINYSRNQVIFLIFYLDMLEVGEWPPECRDSGYTGINSLKRGHTAPFEKAAEIFCEVTYRLEKTGESGEVLKHEIQYGLTDYLSLSHIAKRALNYISGWRRRKMDYKTWLRQSKWRKLRLNLHST